MEFLVQLTVVYFYYMYTFLAGWYGGDVGLAISFSVRLTGVVQFMMREWAQMENQMTAVERIFEYTQLEQESPLESPPG